MRHSFLRIMLQRHDNDVQPIVTGEDEAFQSAIRSELRNSGITSHITAQLRKQIYETLQNCRHVPKHLTNQVRNLEQTAIRSLILEYLICDGLQQTASVLAAETNFLDDSFLSRRDSLRAYDIKPNTCLHSILMENSNTTYEGTTIHILLLQASLSSKKIRKASVNVKSNNLEARKHLDRRLEIINEKYDTGNIDRYDFEQAIESKLSLIQRQCEETARQEYDQKLQQFQNENLTSMRKEEEDQRQMKLAALRLELQKDYELKYQKLLTRESDLKLEYDKKVREKEVALMKERETMRLEMDKINQREANIETMLELERKKIEIEEQRVKHLLAAAQAKLDLAEKKEKALKDDMTAEYNRVRSQAKQSFEDASIITKQHNDYYSNSLQEIKSKYIKFYGKFRVYNIFCMFELRLMLDNFQRTSTSIVRKYWKRHYHG